MPSPTDSRGDLIAELQRASDELDQLLAQLGLGTRNQRAFDEAEERGQLIAQRIVTAFRGANARPTRLLKQLPGGGCWF